MTDYAELIEQLRQLSTEQSNPRSTQIDSCSALEIARLVNAEDKTVADVVETALPAIAHAAELFADTIRSGARVLYVGAGTSGRLGVLDAAECPPTFGTDRSQIIGLISGGYETLVASREGVEDDREAAVHDLDQADLSAGDLVIGIAASRRTPYTLAALAHAARSGCRTIFIICNRAVELPISPTIVIELPVGPEVITGSTRMKSGTAQKMTLNMISTTAMVLLGKTYGNLMVDLKSTSEKLAARSRKILMELLAIDIDRANQLLEQADGSVKVAIAMHKLAVNRAEAEKRLAAAGGRLAGIL